VLTLKLILFFGSMGKRDRKDANKETGRWTKEEHERFMQGIRSTNKGLLQYGKNWKLVEQVVHTRTAAQVRSHAQKFFNRLDREQRKMKHVQEVEASPEEDSSE
jgi:SHAQKYF class myb-like DNA-binding protein